MKFLVGEGPPLRIGGVLHPEGSVVEIIGKAQVKFFEARLVPIADAALVRALEVNSHPMVVVTAVRWGRVDYAPGDILWMPTRSHARQLGEVIRPATAKEVFAWLTKITPSQAEEHAVGQEAAAVPAEAPVGPPRKRLLGRKVREAVKAAGAE